MATKRHESLDEEQRTTGLLSDQELFGLWLWYHSQIDQFRLSFQDDEVYRALTELREYRARPK